MRQLTRADVQLLWQLQAELPNLRSAQAGARLIGSYPDFKSSRHPILAFAFNRVPEAVVERHLLRLAEALKLINAASIQLLHRPIGNYSNREWTPFDSDLALLQRLRDYRVAHFVKTRSLADKAFKDVKDAYGGIFPFLEVAVDKIDDLLLELEDAGLFEPREGLVGSYRVEPTFTEADIAALIKAANEIVPSRA